MFVTCRLNWVSREQLLWRNYRWREWWVNRGRRARCKNRWVKNKLVPEWGWQRDTV